MRNLILRFLNAPMFVLAVAIASALQSSLFNAYPIWYFQPDIVLIAVIWCALRRTFTEGGILVLLFAMVVEIHSSAPSGFFLCIYMAIFLGLRAFSRFFVISQFASLLIVTLGAAVAWKISVLVLLSFFDLARPQLYHFFITLLPFAGIEGVLGFWTYKGLDAFDRITTKSERSRQLIEDELLVEEGL